MACSEVGSYGGSKPIQVNDATSKPQILLAATGSVAALRFGNLCHSFSPWAENNMGDSVLHIELRCWADIMVIAPLLVNTLSKIDEGLCDYILTCVVHAWDYNKTFFVAPAMNTLLWSSPFIERHMMSIDEQGISRPTNQWCNG
ncbi:PREDICTED: phosphopantothenoylcysteine [Prunus dulcis]|uniref:phosphopantothenoylcysteine decarboxylase n=1 Tax=Prunus dulcis TaxID=3755 RepID=A0A5E4G7Q1_PRUDU|nr:PREDICTED: phosphopantothenoylcysteine [Prunus dulcis]